MSKEPLFPHVPKSRQPLFPHATAGRQEQTVLKIECMYCRKPIGEKPGYGVTGTSHSICRQCWAARWPDKPYPEDEKVERHYSRQSLPQPNVVTVTCPICKKVIDIPEYNNTTRTEALANHLKKEHPLLPQVTIEGGEPVPSRYRDLVRFVD